MNTERMLNKLFLPEDADAFARAEGWADAAQMSFYDDRDINVSIAQAHGCLMEIPPMTDRQVEELVEREEAIAGEVAFIAPPPHDIMIAQEPSTFQIHELDKVDSREVYNLSLYVSDDEHTNWQDLAGVY